MLTWQEKLPQGSRQERVEAAEKESALLRVVPDRPLADVAGGAAVHGRDRADERAAVGSFFSIFAQGILFNKF